MQTGLLKQKQGAQGEAGSPGLPISEIKKAIEGAAPNVPGKMAQSAQPVWRVDLVDQLPDASRIAGTEETRDFSLRPREAFGFFVGLRSVLILYAGLGVAAGLAYEVWTLLAK